MAESRSNLKLAIIGASIGQYNLCLKAKELGYETYCFAWSKGAVCKDIVDHFYDISITEIEKIAEICRESGISAVMSNASDFASEQAAAINEILGFPTTPYSVLVSNRDKYCLRNKCINIGGLAPVSYYKFDGVDEGLYPCVVKPCVGGAKAGVCFASNPSEFQEAVKYAQSVTEGGIMVEKYVGGQELSVESISFRSCHTVVQVTQKDSSSAPHFVELGHHQPAMISTSLRQKIEEVIPRILTAIGFTDGPTHIEVKHDGNDNLYLIEANLRSGGDMISSRLVELSTGFDYVKSMVDVATGKFDGVHFGEKRYSGIYYLCSQTRHYLPAFLHAEGKPWLVEREIFSEVLQESRSNYDRNGYLIYCSDKKIEL